MSARPWYKRYPSDFISGTLRMSLEEKGALSMVLDLIYDRGGPIPDDPQWVARVCGCSTRKWKKIKSKLVEFGKIELVDGKIYNARANYELNGRRLNGEHVGEKSVKTGDKPEINGSKPARKPAENEVVSNKTNGLGFSISESRVQNPETTEESESAFEVWWQLVPRKVAKGIARKAFKVALRKTSAETLCGSMRAYTASVAGKEPKYVKHPATWLNGECWEDEDARNVRHLTSIAENTPEERRAARIKTYVEKGVWLWPGEPEPTEDELARYKKRQCA